MAAGAICDNSPVKSSAVVFNYRQLRAILNALTKAAYVFSKDSSKQYVAGGAIMHR
jgi:hypothetical protein